MNYWKLYDNNNVLICVCVEESAPENFVAATEEEYKQFQKDCDMVAYPDILDLSID